VPSSSSTHAESPLDRPDASAVRAAQNVGPGPAQATEAVRHLREHGAPARKTCWRQEDFTKRVRGWSVWYGLGVLLILLAHVVMDTPAPLWGPLVLVWATTILLWDLDYQWRAAGDERSAA
jgi:hypothetical protein